MNKLQASIRDSSAKTWRERKVMYKVGSPMKGCRHCGDVEETDSGRMRYLSGFQVFRAYKPWETKWTWKCWECGAVDLQCWAPDELGLIENEVGKEPIVGARETVRQRKYVLRKEAMGKQDKSEPRIPQRVDEIAKLEARLVELMAMLKGCK